MQTNAAFDVLVIGGGTAGTVAAIQAGRAGARTLLAECSSQLGGTLTNAGVAAPGLFHAWGRQVVAGIGWDLVAAAVREGGGTLPDFSNLSVPFWTHQPQVDPALFAALCDEGVLAAGVDLRLHTMLAALKRDGAGWQVTLCSKDGLEVVGAAAVIDCTGDGNAARMAGAELRAPPVCQPATLSCALEGYDLAALDLPALDRAFVEAVAAGVVRAEDACWRTDRPNASDWLRRRGMNANHVPAAAAAATGAGRTQLEVAGRAAVRRLLRWLRTQPGLANLRAACVFPEIGVRETVTVVGLDTVTVDDYRSGRVWPEAVCHAFYPVDVHGLTSAEWQVEALATGTVPTVPRGALVARGCRGLLMAGRILSSDRLANSALRVQATCMATGQAAGALAALAVQAGVAPDVVPMDALRNLLRQHGAIVPER